MQIFEIIIHGNIFFKMGMRITLIMIKFYLVKKMFFYKVALHSRASNNSCRNFLKQLLLEEIN